jgi:hypothetical protein
VFPEKYFSWECSEFRICRELGLVPVRLHLPLDLRRIRVRTWEEATAVCFRVLSNHVPAVAEDNCGTIDRIAGLPTDKHLSLDILNKKQKF